MNSLNLGLEETLSKLPTLPGVYQFLDKDNKVLYVGKASSLKKRVSSYFSKQIKSAKTNSLVSQISDIEVTVTRSETEALLLESNLIKSIRPKYNVLLRDDKSYPYIHISQSHPFPRIEVKRSKQKPKQGLFFGPYPNSYAVRETLNAIQKIFKIRNCTDTYFSHRKRPCLQYQIQRCSAPCTQYISEEDYKDNLERAIQFLQGKSAKLLKDLEDKMQQAPADLAFEKAASVRDQIKHFRAVQEQQSMVLQSGEVDIIAIEISRGFGCIQCVTVRNGEVLASQAFYPKIPTIEVGSLEALWQEAFRAFIHFHYVEHPEKIPKLILADRPVEEKEALESILSKALQKKCRIQTRPRGAKADWMIFTKQNLQISVEQKLTSKAAILARYEALEALLHLDIPIQRMECFDISHTQGKATVASCVVFDRKGPLKKAYRHYNITNITPGDDYQAMKQALTRRFRSSKEKSNLPDLLVIDGGKGQVRIAKEILDTFNLSSVYLIGVAKGVTRKAGLEHLFLANTRKEIVLPEDSEALHLLQHIRDESHRFAITFHRKKRSKTGLRSSLESIPGVGPKLRRELLLRFGGLQALAKAPADEIAKIPGISAKLAQRIFLHFHD